METNNFKHNIIVNDFIKKVDLATLVRAAVAEGITALNYNDGFIVYFYLTQSKSTGKNWVTLFDVITEVLYARVDGFKKFIFFDDLYNLLVYADNMTEESSKGESSKLISVLNAPDKLLDVVIEKIREIENDNQDNKKV